MAGLIAIVFPDEATAAKAERAARRLADELLVRRDAVAAVCRDEDGTFRVTTSHRASASGVDYGMLWAPLFGLLFFVPVLGMAVGTGLGVLMGAVERAGIDRSFQHQAREALRPGTSALFLVVDRVAEERVVEAVVGKHGGAVLRAPLTRDADEQLQEALHGTVAREPVGA